MGAALRRAWRSDRQNDEDNDEDMAKRPNMTPADAAKAGSKLQELKARILFLIGALIVFRAGTFIPVPGVDPAALASFFDQQAGNMLALFNLFSGGALARFGIFALGIMPYISASIIMQMASHLVEPLQQLRKEGESGRRKIIQYTRYGTVALASFQSVAAASWLQSGAGRWGRCRPARRGRFARRGLPDHGLHHARDRNDVPDVAWRADHRARYR